MHQSKKHACDHDDDDDALDSIVFLLKYLHK
jgi:hypothetical protein